MASLPVIPRELDWVSKRAACSVRTIFKELVEGIENDVISINGTLNEYEDKFAATMLSDNATIVIGKQGFSRAYSRVKVGISDKSIVAVDEAAKNTITATVSLNTEGRCVLRLAPDGTQIEQWQFRMMALQSIFFGDGK